MKIGKWYIVIERYNLCLGFGKPPAELFYMIDRSRRNGGV